MTTPGRLDRIDRPLAPALGALAFALVFLVVRLLGVADGDPSRLAVAGERFAGPGAPASLHVFPGDGYDGQFVYRLALDPLTQHETAFGITLDKPAYRQQRIVLPTLAWALSGGGRPAAVPLALLAVNLAGFAALGWLGGLAARRFGRHALLGVALPLYPGFVLTLARTLTEIVAAALLVGGVLAALEGRRWPAAALLTLAVLARETALVAVIGLALAWGAGRLRGRPRPHPALFLVPAGVEALWLAVLRWRWGAFPFQEGVGNLGIPLAGPLRFLLTGATAQADAFLRAAQTAELAFLGLAVALFVASVRSSTAPGWVRAAWALSLVLVLSLNRLVWVEDWAFLRASTELYVLGTLLVLAAPGVRAAALGAGATLTSLATAGSRFIHI